LAALGSAIWASKIIENCTAPPFRLYAAERELTDDLLRELDALEG
jgi:hypothetical protein